MAEERRFCRFRADADPSKGTIPLPSDGFCLSAFVLLHRDGGPTDVLAGRLCPGAAWARTGGLDRGRMARIGTDWMLPASHLLMFESPDDAACRILREQLGLEGPRLRGPRVVSDPYERPGTAKLDPHWDFHFIYEGTVATVPRPPEGLWDHLEFLDAGRAARAPFARGHRDILDLARSTPVSAGGDVPNVPGV